MTVHGSYYLDEKGNFEHQTTPSVSGSCFAYLDRSYNMRAQKKADRLKTPFYLLIRVGRVNVEAVKLFMDSQFFKTLTEGKIKLVSHAPDTFGGREYNPSSINREGYFEVALDTTLGASRTVTALRLLCILRPLSDLLSDYEEKDPEVMKFLNLAYNGLRANGVAYSDGFVTLAQPRRGACKKAIEEEHGEGEEEYDIEPHHLEEAHGNSWYGTNLSVENLYEIWTRSHEDMEKLTYQDWKLCDKGYFKDCSYDEFENEYHEIPDDAIVSVSAPITVFRKEKGTPLHGLSVLEVCKKLRELELANK